MERQCVDDDISAAMFHQMLMNLKCDCTDEDVEAAPKLVHLLDAASALTREKASAALTSRAFSHEFVFSSISTGAIPRLIATLKDKMYAVRTVAAAALRNILNVAIPTSYTKKSLGLTDDIELAIPLLVGNFTADGDANALGALYSVLRTYDMFISRVQLGDGKVGYYKEPRQLLIQCRILQLLDHDAAFIPSIVKLFINENDDTSSDALNLVSLLLMCVDNADISRKIVEAGGVSGLVNVLARRDDRCSDHANALIALTLIGAPEEARAAGAVPVVRRLIMRKNKNDLAMQCLAAIADGPLNAEGFTQKEADQFADELIASDAHDRAVGATKKKKKKRTASVAAPPPALRAEVVTDIAAGPLVAATVVLPLQQPESRHAIDDDDASVDCSVCMERPASILMAPCGHVVVCPSCWCKVRDADRKCPTCRQSVEGVIDMSVSHIGAQLKRFMIVV